MPESTQILFIQDGGPGVHDERDAKLVESLVDALGAGHAVHYPRMPTEHDPSYALLVPEHNPVLLAKQAASLDALCGGRLSLGVGIGWSREEFAALGILFAGRARRATEYVHAMRTLWREDVASFGGEFVSFDPVRVNPKPVRDRRIPVILGGNTDAALGRAAAWGDGWYGFNLADGAAVTERLATLERLCHESGRSLSDLHVA